MDCFFFSWKVPYPSEGIKERKGGRIYIMAHVAFAQGGKGKPPGPISPLLASVLD